ncbi:MAG: undecaprenyl-phosphate glucose phosphotransferase [Pirellulales bacterium]
MTASRRIYQQGPILDTLHRLADAVCILAGLFVASAYAPPLDNRDVALAAAAALLLFNIVAEISGLYRNWRGVAPRRELLCVAGTWSATLAILSLAAHLLGYETGLRQTPLLVWWITAPTLAACGRIVIRWLLERLRAQGWNTRRYAIVGVNELAFDLSRNIERSPELGLKLVGFYDDRPVDRTPDLPHDVGPRVGNLNDLLRQTQAGEVDLIYLTFPMRAEERIRHVLAELADSTASVYLVPDFFVFELLHARWTNIGGLPAVSVFESPLLGADGWLKRLFDLLATSLLLIALAVPMALIALLVRWTSPGPAFFRQKRYGLDGREILVWKFRSMRVCEDGNTFRQATRNDPRVTPLGAVLRKTSLDELPQLFNVLDGSMSLVGPRPHPNKHNEQFRSLIPGYMLRHKVKPGITGLAQVNGYRGETDTLDKMQKRIECDHQYIRDWSLWLDLKILLRTVLVVLRRQNAY